MKIIAYGISDTGLVREINEDNFLISGFNQNSNDGFVILADGMGGHNAGEVASGTAVSIIGGELEKISNDAEADKIVYDILGSVDYANKKIFDEAQSDSSKVGMGSTLIIAYVRGKKMFVANIGDSRVYIKNKQSITQMTVDHSIVQELVDKGSITPEEALVHPDKNIITRALGTERIVDADMFEYELRVGDIILLCSDGLYEMVRDNVISETLNSVEDIKEATKCLVNLANENGGIDNTTVVLLKVTE